MAVAQSHQRWLGQSKLNENDDFQSRNFLDSFWSDSQVLLVGFLGLVNYSMEAGWLVITSLVSNQLG